VDYVIPERSGEALIVPPLDEVPALLADSRGAEWDGADILGVPLVEFRRRTRARALASAAEYTGTAASPEGPLVVMGHQPVLFHPGVWFKYLLLTRIASSAQAVGLHVIVDTDATGPIGADVPDERAGLVRAHETLVELPADVPLEAASPPAEHAWRGFVERMRAHLATVPLPGLEERLDAWAAGAGDVRDAPSLGMWLARLRRLYEGRAGAPSYLEVPLSSLADTPEFRAFAVHLLRDPDELVRVYNGHLRAYRTAHRLRSPANPFPDLAASCGRIEAPFWVVAAGRRKELEVSRADGRVLLTVGSETIGSIPADGSGVEALASLGVSLRPKAIALTMFARLCLGDLFIHGVGGGRYDRLTDAIALDLFGRRPCPYLVATATLRLPLGGDTAADKRHVLEERLMDLRHNPDRHLAEPSEMQRRLVDEKWELIRAVAEMRRGPDRRAATRRIRAINASLAADLAKDVADAEAKLAALGAADREGAADSRDYPYMLFDPADVAALASVPRPPA
jgi:hypothetical protein